MTASTKLDLNQVAALRRRVSDPALGEIALTSHPACTARCGPACRGGVGRAVSDDRPYPIGQGFWHQDVP